MNLTTLVILLISLAALAIGGVAVLYKRKWDPEYIKKVKHQKNKPLMKKTESYESYMGRHLSTIPYAIALVFILVMLAKCGIV